MKGAPITTTTTTYGLAETPEPRPTEKREEGVAMREPCVWRPCKRGTPCLLAQRHKIIDDARDAHDARIRREARIAAFEEILGWSIMRGGRHQPVAVELGRLIYLAAKETV